MSKISYKFYPIPPEFLADAFITDPDMMRLIRWIFARISTSKSSIPLKKQKRNLELEPFEFMFGRDSCSKEISVTPKKIVVRLNQLIGLGFLKKVVSKTVSTFTVYRVATESFVQISGQQNGQHVGQHVGQQVVHNLDSKNSRSKKDHHPYPSSESEPKQDELLKADDFFQKNEEKNAQYSPLVEKQKSHNIYYQSQTTDIEVVKSIFMTQEMLEMCIKIKGSLENVQRAVKYISEKCQFKIKDWPNALTKWVIKDSVKEKVVDNEKLAKFMEENYAEYSASGWRCIITHDKIKDVKCLLFEPQSGYVQSSSVPITAGDFDKQVAKLLREKKMQKSRIS